MKGNCLVLSDSDSGVCSVLSYHMYVRSAGARIGRLLLEAEWLCAGYSG